MKPQLLTLAQSNLAAATSNASAATNNVTVAQQILDAVTALPDDPIPKPTGFRISRTYGNNVDSPVSAEFTWDGMAPSTPLLECMGAPGNPNGPQEWTGVPVNGVQGPSGEWATLTVEQRTQQTILCRLRAVFNGQYSEPATLQFSTPDNLPEAFS